MRRPADLWGVVVEAVFAGMLAAFGVVLVWALVEFYPS